MPIKQLNPQQFAELTRRQQAEIIAKAKRKTQPDYKLKSAYRYLQRIAAPEGKQRIAKPRLQQFLKPALVRQVDFFRKHELHLREQRQQQKPRRLTLADFPGVQRPTLEEGTLADKIAILISQLGYEQTADALDVADEGLLEKTVTGSPLNRLERYEIDGQFNNLMRDADALDEYEIDADFIEDKASLLYDTIRHKDLNDQSAVREGIADADIDLEKFARAAEIFHDLNNSQLGRILEAYLDQKRGLPTYHLKRDKETGQLSKGRKMRKFDINEMFDAAELDDYDITNVSESEFWAWFRELFY